jgi:hypothetical protein
LVNAYLTKDKMSKDKINYNPEMLIWARLNEGMSLSDAVKKINEIAINNRNGYRPEHLYFYHIEKEYGLVEPLTEADLLKYERSEKQADIMLLKLFAEAYQRCLAALFLEKPPKQDRRIPAGVKMVYHDGTEDSFEFKDED